MSFDVRLEKFKNVIWKKKKKAQINPSNLTQDIMGVGWGRDLY